MRMIGFMGSDQIDRYWRVDKYPDMADIVPMDDAMRHDMGDECWCNVSIIKPTCGGCGQQHFVIVLHNSMRAVDTTRRDTCRDNLIHAAMQER